METIAQKFFKTLRETQFLPPEDMAQYQRGLLDRLLRHARAHVPFYRDGGRLAPLFRRDDSIDWARWPEIPLLTRRDVQTNCQALTSEFVPAEHGTVRDYSTSGSSGEPVNVRDADLARIWAWSALRLRDMEWQGIDPTRRLVFLYPYQREDLAGVRRLPAWRKDFIPLNLIGERLEVSDFRPAPELIEIVASLRPAYLQVPPTTLELMIAYDRKLVLADLKLAAVHTFGEHLAVEAKQTAQHHLGCPVFEHYGSSECGFMASSCPACGGLHVHAEIVLAETVTEDGAPVAPGETGRLLVTPLYNYAMPLIRYDHADFAQVAPVGRCSIHLPAFDAIFGRKRVPFIFPGGLVVRPMPPTQPVVDNLGALACQIAQVAADRCEVRIVPGTIPPADMKFEQMTAVLRSVFWSGLKVDYRIVDALPRRTPRSKVQQCVQEMPPETFAELERQANLGTALRSDRGDGSSPGR